MDLFNIANVGLGLYGAFRARNESKKQQTFYEEQASINKAIGAFNAQVAMRSGEEAVTAIAQETRKMIGSQRALFAGRGIKMDGSPMMVLGETLTMGSKQAQEAYFNAEVQSMNATYNMNTTVASANNMASNAGNRALSNTIDLAKQAMGLVNVSKYEASTGVAPAFNLFKFWNS